MQVQTALAFPLSKVRLDIDINSTPPTRNSSRLPVYCAQMAGRTLFGDALLAGLLVDTRQGVTGGSLLLYGEALGKISNQGEGA